ncbi:hypothetical protein CK203_088828 [Vitis vinifera]|uniref:Uncharacterized protein n=1 Tax=Vitis vinifera TaxID=29760 RepID=A0A438BRM2_VITVI|nr:hypothetical protein CK203_088828 [Vitis vinifera]
MWLCLFKAANAFVNRRARFLMGTNNEQIEHLETGLGVVQEELQRMELGMIDKLHHLEEALNRLRTCCLLIRSPQIRAITTKKTKMEVGRSSHPNQPS